MSDFNPTLTQRILHKAKRRVVKDWKSRIKDFSTISLGLGTALQGAWLVFPEDLKAGLPAKTIGYVLGAILVWGLAGKFIIQGPQEEKP
jgi:hypothetical protein